MKIVTDCKQCSKIGIVRAYLTAAPGEKIAAIAATGNYNRVEAFAVAIDIAGKIKVAEEYLKKIEGIPENVVALKIGGKYVEQIEGDLGYLVAHMEVVDESMEGMYREYRINKCLNQKEVNK